VRAKEYADYYPELPGGKIGRALEVYPISKNSLGPWKRNMAAPAALPVMTDDVSLLTRASVTFSAATRGVQLVLRLVRGRASGKRIVAGIGVALAGAQLRATLRRRNVKRRTETPMADRVMDGERVVGVNATPGGGEITIGAR